MAYSTRKRAKEMEPNPLTTELAKVSASIEGLKNATTVCFERLVSVLEENNKTLALALSQLKKLDKRMEKVLECVTSMDESLLDMAVSAELAPNSVGSPEKRPKKDISQRQEPQSAAKTFQYPLPPELLSNHALFFTATDPLRPLAQLQE